MAAVIIAPHDAPAPLGTPQRRPHLRPVPDLPTDRPVRSARPGRPAPTSKPTAAVYRRRRLAAALVALGVAAVVVLGSFVAVGARIGGAPAPASGANAIGASGAELSGSSTYVVRPGDTLWAIAGRVAPDGDVRAVVDALAERTGGAELRVGQTIDLDGLG